MSQKQANTQVHVAHSLILEQLVGSHKHGERTLAGARGRDGSELRVLTKDAVTSVGSSSPTLESKHRVRQSIDTVEQSFATRYGYTYVSGSGDPTSGFVCA